MGLYVGALNGLFLSRSSEAPLEGCRGRHSRRAHPRAPSTMRPCRALGGDKELGKWNRAGGGGAAAAAQWQRVPMPCHFGVHGGYFAPARRYGARAALARTQR